MLQQIQESARQSGSIINSVITCRNIPVNATLAILKGNQTTGFIQVYPAQNFSVATLLTPYQNQRSYAGISADHVGTTTVSSNLVASFTGLSIGFGSSYANTNIFDNLDYGVYALYSNVTVDNNAFQFLTGSTTLNHSSTPEYGIGVYGFADGHPGLEKVFIVGNGAFGVRNTFYECNRGIDINAYHKTTVFKNRFKSTQVYSASPPSTQSAVGNYAAFIKTGRYISIDVTNNDIVNWNIGIALIGDVVINSQTQQFKFFGDARISDNRVCPTETNFGTITTQCIRQAITAQNIIPPCAPSCLQTNPFGRLYINDNDLNNVFNGISVQGWLRRPQVASTVTGSQNIYLRYQAPAFLNTFPQAGIRIINCDAPVVYDNHINGASQNLTKTAVRGIYVTKSAASIVKCNDITSVGQCMVFEGTNANSIVFKNYMYTSQDGLVLLNNGKIGPQGSAPIPFPLPNGISSDNQWIGPFSHAATFTNNTLAPNTHSPFYYRNNTLIEHPTNALNVTWSGGTPSLDDYNAPGSFVQVPQAAQGTNCNLPPSLVLAGNGLPNQRLALQNIVLDTTTSDSTELWLRKQQVYFMLRKDPSWMNNSVPLQQFYAATQPSAIGTLDSVDVELSDNNLASASAVNGTLNAQSQVQQNQRDVNSIYASVMNGNPATAQQVTDLWNIAYQCPLTGGNGVYRARTLLCLIENEILFFEDSCDAPTQGARMIQQQAQAEISNNNNCKVYPNPNNGEMILSYNSGEQQKVSFTIFDMTGRELSQYDLLSGSQVMNINLTGLAAGMYYYVFYVDGKPSKSEKIIINK